MTTPCLPVSLQDADQAMEFYRAYPQSYNDNTSDRVLQRLDSWVLIALRLEAYPTSSDSCDEDWRQEVASNIAHWSHIHLNNPHNTEERQRAYAKLIAASIIRNTMNPDGTEADTLATSRHVLPDPYYPTNISKVSGELEGRRLWLKYSEMVYAMLPHAFPVTSLLSPGRVQSAYHAYSVRYRIEYPAPALPLDMNILLPPLPYDERSFCRFVCERDRSNKYSVIKTKDVMSPAFGDYPTTYNYKEIGAKESAEVALVGFGNMTVTCRNMQLEKMRKYMYALVCSSKTCDLHYTIFPGVRCLEYETSEGNVSLPMEFSLFPDHEKFALKLCIARLKEQKIQNIKTEFQKNYKLYASFNASSVYLPGQQWALHRMMHLKISAPHPNPVDAKLHEARIKALEKMCEPADLGTKNYLPEVKVWARCLEAKYILDHILHLCDKPTDRLELTTIETINTMGRIVGVPVQAGLTITESVHEYWAREREWQQLLPYVENLISEIDQDARTPELARRVRKLEEKKTSPSYWNYDPETGNALNRRRRFI